MIGRELAQYRLVERLGIGGMGEVFLAEDTRLERQVALKILHPRTTAERERLLIEARAASALNHPAVAHVYEIGEADGIPFIAMEYVRGMSLAARIGGVPMRPAEIVNIAVQIADAMVEAYRKGVVHRDLKPANIMVTARGEAKILDFGLARLDRRTAQERLTEPGVMVGTLDYMSPEQAIGEEADVRSDIFSFGIVLYEMATGRRPFAEATGVALIGHLVHGEAPGVRQLNDAVPDELARVIDRCLARDAADRYQSPQPLFNDLQALQRESQRRALIHPAGERPRRRSGAVAAALAAGALAIAAGVWGVSRSGVYLNDRIESLAVVPFAHSGAEASTYLADGLTESLINSMSQLDDLKVISRPTVFRYKGASVTPTQVSRDLNVRAVLTGRVVQTGNEIEVHTELIDARRDTQIWGARFRGKLAEVMTIEKRIANQVAAELRQEISRAERDRIQRATTSSPEAFSLYLEGRQLLDARKTAKASQLFHQAVEKDPAYALAWAALSQTYIIPAAKKRGEAAQQLYAKAQTAAERALQLDPELVEVQTSLADLKYTYQWNWSEADALFRKAIASDPDYATAHHWYALFLAYTGRGSEAIAPILRAHELEPDSLIITINVARVHYFARRYQDAISYAKRALEMNPDHSGPRLILSLAYEQLSDFSSWAREREEHSLANGNGDFAEAIRTGFAAGGFPEANRRYLAALERRRAEGERIDPNDFFETHVRLGNYDEAIKYAEEMYAQRNQAAFRLSGHPVADPIRHDPRFARLLSAMKLPNAGART